MKPSLFAELRRRNVFRAGAFYLAATWLLAQVVTQILPVFDAPSWLLRWVIGALAVGFPFWIAFAWFYEFTPEGLKRESEVGPHDSIAHHTGRKLDFAIIGVLATAVVLLVTDRFVLHHGVNEEATILVPEKSIAVLPFENLSDDKANAYFADGIQDEILTRLAKIGALAVISRTSTQQYASRPGNLREIAGKLGVANIMQGSVQKAGDTVRINVQLIRASDDRHIWAEIYDRKLDNIFGVESEVATAIADALQAKLTGAEHEVLAARTTGNPAAYDAFLQGLAISHRTDEIEANTARAIVSFEEAVRLDPGFSTAWARLSRQHALAYWYGDLSPGHKEAALKALETSSRLAPSSSETLTAQGMYLYRIERDYAAARETFDRLRKLAPNDDTATYALALIARRQGRWADSLALFEQAIAISPLDMSILTNADSTATALRDWSAAQRFVDSELSLGPDDPAALMSQVYVLQPQGEIDRAQKILDRMRKGPGDFDAITAFAYNAYLSRAHAPAIALLESLLAKPENLGSALGTFQQLVADLQRQSGDMQAAKTNYKLARATLEAALRKQPENPAVVQSLALVEAGLDNLPVALAYARRAIELKPVSKDSMSGPIYEETLARLQSRFGDKDAAIAALRHLLDTPYLHPITAALLRLDPDFDNLRGDSRFEQLLMEDTRATTPTPGKESGP